MSFIIFLVNLFKFDKIKIGLESFGNGFDPDLNICINLKKYIHSLNTFPELSSKLLFNSKLFF